MGSTYLRKDINVMPGECVSLMHNRTEAFGTVRTVIREERTQLTKSSRALVTVTAGRATYLGVWVYRDALGYLYETPAFVCEACESTCECDCQEGMA